MYTKWLMLNGCWVLTSWLSPPTSRRNSPRNNRGIVHFRGIPNQSTFKSRCLYTACVWIGIFTLEFVLVARAQKLVGKKSVQCVSLWSMLFIIDRHKWSCNHSVGGIWRRWHGTLSCSPIKTRNEGWLLGDYSHQYSSPFFWYHTIWEIL